MRKSWRVAQRETGHAPAAGNGLLDRRLFLSGAALLAEGGAAGLLAGPALRTEALTVPPWSRAPGIPFIGYGQPSPREAEVARIWANLPNAPGTGAARTPIHRLAGAITPNGLHFERSHSGIPEIDPEAQRLLLPGYEGNMNVKWLRRIKLVAAPVMTKDETSKYTILRPDGKAWQFVFAMAVKSVITRPSPGVPLHGPGLYEVSGIAWSGNGRIRQVEVSADRGRSWAPAALQAPVLPKAVTRFRIPWRWDRGAAILQSRATDETGETQPLRDAFIADRGNRDVYHYNTVAAWAVGENGEAHNVYA